MNTVSFRSDLTLDSRPGYLYARISEPSIDTNRSLEYFAKIALRCGEDRWHKLLIERDNPTVSDDTGLRAALNEYLRMSSGMVIAFVDPNGELDAETQDTVNAIPGRAVRFAYFTDIKPAEEWLIAQPLPDLFDSRSDPQ